MAEEKSEKSIMASDDGDEYSCDTELEPTELSSILDRLSLGPKKEKKKLLVLSPSGLLLHRVHKKSMRETPKNRSPDASCGPNLLYKRPFAEEFMKFCLERFEVGIWSSAWELDQKHCTDSGLSTLDNSTRPLLFKVLSKVFQCFKGFSASNIIFIDDEPYKALLNPVKDFYSSEMLFIGLVSAPNFYTRLFPVTYDPTDERDDFLDREGEFCSYLDDIAKSSDVQAYTKENSFGQPKIDSSHPDWSFYRKASKNVSNLA